MLLCVNLQTGTGCGAANRDAASFCQQCGLSLRFALPLRNPGTQVGQYRIAKILGHGAFGAVYGADSLQYAANRVAIKETFDPSSIRGFRTEFAVLRRLHHRNLPAYYDMFEADGNGYLIMELIPGQSLQDVLDRQHGPLPESQVLSYASQLCDVLSYLHGQNPSILHRDIKPDNIRLTPEGLIKLVDFGLLKQGAQQTRNTIRGFGTPEYAPLEQYGGGSTDARSDIYSLGATLYHLLTYQLPPTATARLAAPSDPLPSPQFLQPAVSHHVAEAIVTAMSLFQKDRYVNAAMLKQAIEGTERHLGKVASATFPADHSSVAQPAFRIRKAHLLHGQIGRIISVAYSHNGQTLGSGSSDNTVVLWRAADGRLLQTWQWQGVQTTSMAFSPDGQTVASGSTNNTVFLWRAADGNLLRGLKRHGDWVSCVTYSPDRQTLASASWDETIRLWSVAEGDLLRTLRGHNNGVTCLTYSPDGRTLASGSVDGVVGLWNVADGGLLQLLRIHDNNVACIAYSPDGRTLASASDDATIRLQSASDGHLLRTLQGHAAAVTCVAYGPDGQTLASASDDATIRLWRVSDGRLLHEVQDHQVPITCLAYSPDGRILASGSEDATVQLWRLD